MTGVPDALIAGPTGHRLEYGRTYVEPLQGALEGLPAALK